MYNSTSRRPRSGEFAVRGWTAPEDADQPQTIHASFSYPPSSLVDHHHPSHANSFSPPYNYAGHVPAMSSPAIPGSSAAWMDPRMQGADLPVPVGMNNYQGSSDYGASPADRSDMGLGPHFASGWQHSRPGYGNVSEASGFGDTPYDANLHGHIQGWQAPGTVRRSLSYGHDVSPPPFASVPSMHPANAAADLLPRSSTAPPADARLHGGASSGGERCRWGGQCQAIITDLTASGINRHLKECHVQPWDDRTRGYCQWEGGTCSKKLLYYFGFGKHVASVHIRSTASQCELCGQILARGDTLDRHVKRFCHGRPPGQ